MAKTGSKDTPAIEAATAKIETLTSLLKKKRITVRQYADMAAQAIAEMSGEKDFAAYMKMVGYHEKLGLEDAEIPAEAPAETKAENA